MRRLFTLLIMLFSSSVPAAGLTQLDDLQTLYKTQGVNAEGKSKVVLLLVSQPNCSYCVQITEEILKPMLISKEYDSTTLIRELKINSGGSIRDFSGNRVNNAEFAQRYGAWATPTLLYLDGKGQQKVEKMIGFNTPELYGYYVDRSLRQAYSQINP